MNNTPIPPPPAAVPIPCPSNYLVFSILTTLFCCLPTGIVAIIYSCKVSSLYNENRMQDAQQASQWALRWNIVSIILGIVGLLLYSLASAALYPILLKEMEAQNPELMRDLPAEIQREMSDEFEITE